MYSTNVAVNVASNVCKIILQLDGAIIPNNISPNLVSENSGAQCTNRVALSYYDLSFRAILTKVLCISSHFGSYDLDRIQSDFNLGIQ